MTAVRHARRRRREKKSARRRRAKILRRFISCSTPPPPPPSTPPPSAGSRGRAPRRERLPPELSRDEATGGVGGERQGRRRRTGGKRDALEHGHAYRHRLRHLGRLLTADGPRAAGGRDDAHVSLVADLRDMTRRRRPGMSEGPGSSGRMGKVRRETIGSISRK